MKKVLIFISFFLFALTACNDNCVSSEIAACNDSVPNDQVTTCQAYFVSWFFDSSTSTCSEIGYSGCSEIGFQTKEECEACKCND